MAEISALLVMSDKILHCFQLQRGKSFNQSLLVIIWKEGTRFGWKVCEPLTDVSSTDQQKIIGSEILVENEHPRMSLQEVTHCVGGKNNHIHGINLRAEHFAHFLCVSVSEIVAKPAGRCQAGVGGTPLL